ncbi:MAG: hypothetical protein KF788_20870 [Piscinibacter sp.]|nr:hypothetical protein [Piscinibacter sp.]
MGTLALRAACVLLLAASGTFPATAASPAACYVRTEAFDLPAASGAASVPAQSYVGLRRKTDQLFDVELSVTDASEATCSVSGVARLRGEPGAEVLGIVVRPDPSRKSGRTGTLCQVFVQLTAEAIELRTTPAACQAQALCEGRVELNGQRFEHASKLPPGAPGPCFERRTPVAPAPRTPS